VGFDFTNMAPTGSEVHGYLIENRGVRNYVFLQNNG
jgi:hypothetical protein